MTLIKNSILALASFALLGLPALAFAHESDAQLDADVSSAIGAPHPALTSGVLIGSGGSVVVSGATVNSVSGATVSAHSTLGSSIFNWLLNTSSTTKFKGMGTTTLADVKAGDTISFAGILSSVGTNLVVSVDALRDWAMPAASTTASTTVSHENKGKHLGWFKNWFGGIFPFSIGAKANVHAENGDNQNDN